MTVPKLVLMLLLLAAQSGALAHAFEHDAGALQNRACAICVTLSQLDSSCANASADTDIEHCHACQAIERAATLESFHALVARQRGPPQPL
ncbi:MAG: hypothetical protein IIA09_01985 [Proteobacteria bacterium]|nr:hypothetical protein [Pseudomonadota bacterium]